MANVYATRDGNWSDTTMWNTLALPTASDDVFANNFTVQVDVTAIVLSLRNTSATLITAGGSFVLSTPNTTVSVNSLVASATNLIIANAISGTNTLNSTSGIQGLGVSNTTIISYTGAGNLTIIIPSVIGGTGSTNNTGITKSGLGTLTVGNSTNPTTIRGGTGVGANTNYGINSSNGDIVIVGNVQGPNSSGTNMHGINQSNGKLTITGNVIGGTTAAGIAISSLSPLDLEIIGNVTSSVTSAINKSVGAIIITGNVTGSAAVAITGITGAITVTGIVTGGAASAITGTPTSVTVTGDVIAGGAVGISITGTNTTLVTGVITPSSTAVAISSQSLVRVNTPLVNVNNFQAVYAPRITIESTTTSITFQKIGGGNQIMYIGTADNTNLPAVGNVRSGTTFGVSNEFTGTMVVQTPPYVSLGALVDDNKVGTFLMTPASFVAELGTSTLDIAKRLQNSATVITTGTQLASFNI